jgi:hypothetical protein
MHVLTPCTSSGDDWLSGSLQGQNAQRDALQTAGDERGVRLPYAWRLRCAGEGVRPMAPASGCGPRNIQKPGRANLSGGPVIIIEHSAKAASASNRFANVSLAGKQYIINLADSVIWRVRIVPGHAWIQISGHRGGVVGSPAIRKTLRCC